MNIKLAYAPDNSSRVLINEVYSGMVHPSRKTGYAYRWLTYEKGLQRHGYTIDQVKPHLAKLLGIDEQAIEVFKL